MSRRFDKLVADSGLPKIRLHDLRHTSASLGSHGGEPGGGQPAAGSHLDHDHRRHLLPRLPAVSTRLRRTARLLVSGLGTTQAKASHDEAHQTGSHASTNARGDALKVGAERWFAQARQVLADCVDVGKRPRLRRGRRVTRQRRGQTCSSPDRTCVASCVRRPTHHRNSRTAAPHGRRGDPAPPPPGSGTDSRPHTPSLRQPPGAFVISREETPMSKETLEHLNTNTLIGNTDAPRHRLALPGRAAGRASPTTTRPDPGRRRQRRLFDWQAESRRIAVEVPADVDTMTHLDRDRTSRCAGRSSRTGRRSAAPTPTTVMGIFAAGYAMHQYDEWLLDHGRRTSSTTTCRSAPPGCCAAARSPGSRSRSRSRSPPPKEWRSGPTCWPPPRFDGSIATTFKRTVTDVVCDNTREAAPGRDRADLQGQALPLLPRPAGPGPGGAGDGPHPRRRLRRRGRPALRHHRSPTQQWAQVPRRPRQPSTTLTGSR